MNQWFFSYFWHSYFLGYVNFVEYMNMHAAGFWHWQNSVGQPIILNGGRQVVHAMNWCSGVVWPYWTLHPWRHNCWGVIAGQVGHNSSNVGGVTAGQVGHNSSMYNSLFVAIVTQIGNAWRAPNPSFSLEQLLRTELLSKLLSPDYSVLVLDWNLPARVLFRYY